MKENIPHLIWSCAGVIVCAMFVALCAYSCHQTTLEKTAAMEAGLVEKPNVGTVGYHWDKP